VDCEHAQDCLNARFFGELANDEREQVAIHLSGCALCREVVKESRCLERLARELQVAPVPRTAALRRARWWGSWVGRRIPGKSVQWRWILAMAVASSIVLTVWLLVGDIGLSRGMGKSVSVPGERSIRTRGQSITVGCLAGWSRGGHSSNRSVAGLRSGDGFRDGPVRSWSRGRSTRTLPKWRASCGRHG